MGCQWYLAMSAAELHGFHGPQPIAWMACRFSSHNTGLCNLPQGLPPGSLILLDDSDPIDTQDPNRVVSQLLQLCRSQAPAGVVLDLQRQKTKAAETMVRTIAKALPCPVAVTEDYANITHGPVLVSAPIHLPLPQVIAPWQGRQIWLDLPFGKQTVLGKEISPITPLEGEDFPHYDKFLHCRYKTEPTPRGIQFTLCRTGQMLPQLLQQAAQLGICKAIGLYQEYKK